jgi:hypothetical protein
VREGKDKNKAQLKISGLFTQIPFAGIHVAYIVHLKKPYLYLQMRLTSFLWGQLKLANQPSSNSCGFFTRYAVFSLYFLVDRGSP